MVVLMRICPKCSRNKAEKGQLCDVCAGKELKEKRQKQKAYDRRRGSAVKRGYDRQWQKVRGEKLGRDPFCECERCQTMGRVKAAGLVHHIKPVETHPHLRLVIENLMSMSWFCHEVEEGRARDYKFEFWQKGEGWSKS